MANFYQDLKLSIRILINKPGFAITAILIIAIGIGASTAIFSIVNGVLLRPLPSPNSERLIKVWESFVGGGTGTASVPNLKDWRAQNQAFETISAYSTRSYNLQGRDNPEQVSAAEVSPDFFQTFAIDSSIGRTFTIDEDTPGRSHVVVLSDQLWRANFGADPALVGRNITLDGQQYLVSGIMPPAFRFPSRQTQLWVPLVLPQGQRANRGNHYLFAIGLLKPGVTFESAQQEMHAIASRIEQEYPGEQAGRSIKLIPLKEEMVANIRPALLMLLGAVGFLLLIACANVANLQLVRASSRQKEVAIRSALGANSLRLARQFLTESIVLAGAGGILGILASGWALKLLLAMSEKVLPRSGEVSVDLRVLGTALAITLITGIAFGLAPAIYSARSDGRQSLNEGGRGLVSAGHNRVYTTLIAVETAMAAILLVGAGLMMKSFLFLERQDTGLRPYHVLTLRVSLPEPAYPDRARVASFYKRATEELTTLPGVESAGFISLLPLQRWGYNKGIEIQGREPFPPGRVPFIETRAITPGYLAAMGIPLVKGRGFTEQDGKDSLPVVIINQMTAALLPTGQDPIGAHLRFGGGDTPWATVVGVTRDVKQSGIRNLARPEALTPYSQEFDTGLVQSMSLAVRSNLDPMSLVPSVRQAVRRVDPSQPIYNVQTMEAVIGDSISDTKINTILLGIFAGIALLLALVGIYGVVSYWATQRTREIGIRVAIGANRRQVLGLVVRHGMLPALCGLTLGIPGSYALARLLTGLIYGVSPFDPPIFASIAAALGLAALLACLIPARRATRLHPMAALREE
ncbi:MAG TPA: ABC transporter permease [Blastocatellia bacterium]|nr:ABC transporter permease [Blastocatellia bacterium]